MNLYSGFVETLGFTDEYSEGTLPGRNKEESVEVKVTRVRKGLPLVFLLADDESVQSFRLHSDDELARCHQGAATHDNLNYERFISPAREKAFRQDL